MNTAPPDSGAVCTSCRKPASQCQCATLKVDINEELARAVHHPPSASNFEGRYRIIEQIGVGGMGTVYRAEHVVLHKQIAVKVLRAELLSDSQAMARFEQEARACAALSHPNLVAVFDCGITELGQPFLVMEFLSGKNLLDIVKQDGELSLKMFFKIFIEVSEGLSYAHEHGVIHRDLKPSNILLSSDPRGGEITKIVDFGVAKIEDLGGEFQMLTRTGEVFGSPAYMSPEQCQGNQVDQRADIYALGCVMYEALSGKQAFKGANIMTVMNSQLETYPPAPARMSGETIPAELQDVVMRCLQKDPEKRYQRIIELRQDLERAKELSTFNKPVVFGSLRLPSLTVPILVSLAVLASILSYPALMPGGSLNGLSTMMRSAPTSKYLMAAYSQRRNMPEYAYEVYLSMLQGPESKSLSLSERSAIAVLLLDQIYTNEPKVLELFRSPISGLMDKIDMAVKNDSQSVAAAGWSAPLIYYYVGRANEKQKQFIVAKRRYSDGVALANRLNSPKWVKAKLHEELGELYLKLPTPQPLNAIPELREARRLLFLERNTIRTDRKQALINSTNLLFDALTQSNNEQEAAELMESFISYEQEQPNIDSETVLKSIKTLIELYRNTNNQERIQYWQNERLKIAKKGEASAPKPTTSAPYTVQLLRGLNARTDKFRKNAIFERFHSALNKAEEENASDLDKIAIAAATLEVCSECWEVDESEKMYKRIEPILAKLRSRMKVKESGKLIDTGHAALALHYLAEAEYQAKKFDRARNNTIVAKQFCLGQPDGEWTAGRLDVLEAKILVQQNKDLDEAEQSAVNGINRLGANRLANSNKEKNFRLADAYWTLGQVLRKKKQFQKARSQINMAIAIVKDTPDDWRTDSYYQPELDEIAEEEKTSHK